MYKKCPILIVSLSFQGLSFYWFLSSVYGLGQCLLIMSPKFKRIVGIPKMPSELDKPYRQIYESIFKSKEKV